MVPDHSFQYCKYLSVSARRRHSLPSPQLTKKSLNVVHDDTAELGLVGVIKDLKNSKTTHWFSFTHFLSVLSYTDSYSMRIKLLIAGV